MFDTFLDSLKILYASLSNFRHLTQEDMEAYHQYVYDIITNYLSEKEEFV